MAPAWSSGILTLSRQSPARCEGRILDWQSRWSSTSSAMGFFVLTSAIVGGTFTDPGECPLFARSGRL